MMNIVLITLSLLVVLSSGFNCPPLPPHVPANVTDLRDIKVVMSLGDSITAGFGIMGEKGFLKEFRGLSWDIGGDENATTMANFLRFYTPDLQGSSHGSHPSELCYGPFCPPNQYHPDLDVLNSAQSGAMVMDLVTHEFNYLLQSLKNNTAINFEEDWKLLTILIGANDLCVSCTFAKEFLTPDEFEKHLSALLENVRLNIPRVFVQVAEMFNISQVELYIECDCVFSPEANQTRSVIDDYVQQYNARVRALAAYYQALGQQDFVVVAQPFGRNTALKNQPTDVLSSLDCFHPSLVAHQAMAVALWNNMITPAAQKKTSMNITDTPLCPTANTLLYTY